jgi:hypothetical protein
MMAAVESEASQGQLGTPPSGRVRGPVRAAWREGTLTRAKELEALSLWLLGDNPSADCRHLADGILYHLEAARQAAEDAELNPRRRVWIFRGGSRFERAMSNLDAAEALLLNVASPGYVLGQMPSLLNDVQRHLLPTDPRRQELERIAQRLGARDPGHPLLDLPEERGLAASPGAGRPDEAPDNERDEAWATRRLAQLTAFRERVLDDERGKIVTAMRGARSEALREQLRVRSFTNVLVATILGMTLLAVGVALLGYWSPTAVPLCFAPEEAGRAVVVCPTAHSGPVPTGQENGRDLDMAIQQAVRTTDLLLVEVLGLTAAAVAAAVAIRGIRGSSVALHLPVLLAVLKLPTGAITAFLGLLLMRGQFVPGLSALDTPAQILAWALVFGYAQQLFTRFVDRQGQTVLESVRSADKHEPSPAPP